MVADPTQSDRAVQLVGCKRFTTTFHEASNLLCAIIVTFKMGPFSLIAITIMNVDDWGRVLALYL